MNGDTFLQKGKRRELVETIAAKGIRCPQVLQAIASTPRHIFFPDYTMQEYAYNDKAYPIGEGQTISQPYTVAFQTQLLQIQKGDKILEIGTGSGYQAAILNALGAKVYTIERQKKLHLHAKELFKKHSYLIQTFLGDGYKGVARFAPFDKIIITAAAPYISRELLDQLAIGGILVAPVGEQGTQKMLRIKKLSDTEFEQSEHGNFSFVPMLSGIVQ